MGFFSRLFGSHEQMHSPAGTKLTTTVDNPFRIDAPTIGFLNLHGSDAKVIAKADQVQLASLFAHSYSSDGPVPKCAILFLYCNISSDGKVAGRPENLRKIIQAAGA